MTSTIERPPTETTGQEEGPHRQNRTLRFVALVVGVVALVVGGVLIYNAVSDDDSASAIPDDVQQVIDDYIDAAVGQDRAAWEATITDDFFYRRYIYTPADQQFSDYWSKTEDSAGGIRHRIEFYNQATYEQLGDTLATGDGPWFVTMGQRWVDEDAGIAWNGNATYVVVERDGAMRIASETYTGTAAPAEG